MKIEIGFIIASLLILVLHVIGIVVFLKYKDGMFGNKALIGLIITEVSECLTIMLLVYLVGSVLCIKVPLLCHDAAKCINYARILQQIKLDLVSIGVLMVTYSYKVKATMKG